MEETVVRLVRLVELPAGRRRRVHRAASFAHDALVAPVVLVASVVLDGLLHALSEKGRDVD